jgi:predicted PurR-regulated permease PerM
MIVLFFHPGDLGITEWLMLLGMLGLLIGLPVVIVGFIIYKIATRGSEKLPTGVTKEE